jgi:hypothetical protein
MTDMRSTGAPMYPAVPMSGEGNRALSVERKPAMRKSTTEDFRLKTAAEFGGLAAHQSVWFFLTLVWFCVCCMPRMSLAVQVIDEGIVITNENPGIVMTTITNYDAGPCTGGILNVHFYPGLQDYMKGNNAYAKQQMDYFLARPDYTSINPRQGQYLSLAYYIRGMIYQYHASGIGRQALAAADFKNSIQTDPKNYLAYLELARVYTSLDRKKEAINTLESVLKLKLPASIETQAKAELADLQKQGGLK